jgi:hypothetical protein
LEPGVAAFRDFCTKNTTALHTYIHGQGLDNEPFVFKNKILQTNEDFGLKLELDSSCSLCGIASFILNLKLPPTT